MMELWLKVMQTECVALEDCSRIVCCSVHDKFTHLQPRTIADCATATRQDACMYLQAGEQVDLVVL